MKAISHIGHIEITLTKLVKDLLKVDQEKIDKFIEKHSPNVEGLIYKPVLLNNGNLLVHTRSARFGSNKALVMDFTKEDDLINLSSNEIKELKFIDRDIVFTSTVLKELDIVLSIIRSVYIINSFSILDHKSFLVLAKMFEPYLYPYLYDKELLGILEQFSKEDIKSVEKELEKIDPDNIKKLTIKSFTDKYFGLSMLLNF